MKEEIKLNLGNKIKMLREIKGFSQEALAHEIGISQQAFQKIEAGETKISVERAARIAKSLELELESLINFQPANYLNNCTQSGVMYTYNNYLPDKLIEQLEKQVAQLSTDLQYYQEQNAKLLEMLNKAN